MARLIETAQQIRGSQIPQAERKKAEQKLNSSKAKKKTGNPRHR